MDNLEKVLSNWSTGAIIAAHDNFTGVLTFREAVFAYPIRRSIAWVHPSYAEPANDVLAAIYLTEGKVIPFRNGITFSDFRMANFMIPLDENYPEMLKYGLEVQSFFADLKSKNVPWSAERSRVRGFVSEFIRRERAKFSFLDQVAIHR